MCTSMFQFFLKQKDVFMTGSQGFVSYFYNHNNNSYNKIWIFRKLMYFSFSKLYYNHTRIVGNLTNTFWIWHFTNTCFTGIDTDTLFKRSVRRNEEFDQEQNDLPLFLLKNNYMTLFFAYTEMAPDKHYSDQWSTVVSCRNMSAHGLFTLSVGQHIYLIITIVISLIMLNFRLQMYHCYQNEEYHQTNYYCYYSIRPHNCRSLNSEFWSSEDADKCSCLSNLFSRVREACVHGTTTMEHAKVMHFINECFG